MASFSVLTKEASADLKLVREGFVIPAFLLGPIWFAWRRAWLGAALTLIGILLIGGGLSSVGAPPVSTLAALGIFMALMALEAPEFVKRALVRRGFKVSDVVESRNWSEAETRFLARRLSRSRRDAAAEASTRPFARQPETVGLIFNGS